MYGTHVCAAYVSVDICFCIVDAEDLLAASPRWGNFFVTVKIFITAKNLIMCELMR
jgi:hypothetical protein